MTRQLYEVSNSFTKKPSPYQILSYLIIISQLCVFYIGVYPYYYYHDLQLTSNILFIVCKVVEIVCGLICSLIDPVDDYVCQLKSSDEDRIQSIKIIIESSPSRPSTCNHCQSFVRNDSRHCRICKRCCQKFDHHCVWINNCIGQKNYKVFICMVIGSLLSKIVLVISIVLLTTQNQWSYYKIVVVIDWIALGFLVFIIIILICLLLFHCYLSYRRLSTYEFINITKISNHTSQQSFSKSKEQIKTENSFRQLDRQIQSIKIMNQSMNIQPTISNLQLYVPIPKRLLKAQPHNVVIGQHINDLPLSL